MILEQAAVRAAAAFIFKLILYTLVPYLQMVKMGRESHKETVALVAEVEAEVQ